MSANAKRNSSPKDGSGTRSAATASSSPRFLKVLRRVADSAPGGASTKSRAYSLVDELKDLYFEASILLKKYDDAVDGLQNIRATTTKTNRLNITCQSVGVPFYDDEWVETYWIPMCRLITEIECDELVEEALVAMFNVFLKVDMAPLSSHCKSEVLKVLGELLEMDLTTVRANEAVNLVLKVLFDDRPTMLESNSARRATSKIGLKSDIIKPFLKFLASQPLESERRDQRLVQARKDTKYEICYLLNLFLVPALADTAIAAKHEPSIQAAISSVSPQLWVALDQIVEDGMGLIDATTNSSEETRLATVSRVQAANLAFQCLAVFSNNAECSVQKQHNTSKLELSVLVLSRFQMKGSEFDTEEIHRKSVRITKLVTREKIPFKEEVSKDYFVHLSPLTGFSLCYFNESSNDRSFALCAGQKQYPFMEGLPSFSDMFPGMLGRKEDLEQMLHQVLNEQKERGLLDENHKSAVREPPAGAAKCAYCGEVGVSNLKLMRCSGCNCVSYCGTGCQKADWKTHKAFCRKQNKTTT